MPLLSPSSRNVIWVVTNAAVHCSLDPEPALRKGKRSSPYHMTHLTYEPLTTPTVLTAPNATLELLITDAGSGVDPAALTVIVDANQADTTFDTRTGKTTVKLPPLGAGAHKLSVTVADFQETKNMESVPGVLPNTTTFATTFTARTG